MYSIFTNNIITIPYQIVFCTVHQGGPILCMEGSTVLCAQAMLHRQVKNIFPQCVCLLCGTKEVVFHFSYMSCTLYTIHCSEASLIVPDFVISVYSSSCNFLFFCLFIAPWLSHSIYWHSQGRMKCQEIVRERKEERLGPKKRKCESSGQADVYSRINWRIFIG